MAQLRLPLLLLVLAAISRVQAAKWFPGDNWFEHKKGEDKQQQHHHRRATSPPIPAPSSAPTPDLVAEAAHTDAAGCHWPARGEIKTWADVPASEEELSPGGTARVDCYAHPQKGSALSVPRTAEDNKLRCEMATWTEIKDSELGFYYDACAACRVSTKSAAYDHTAWFENCKHVCNFNKEFNMGMSDSKNHSKAISFKYVDSSRTYNCLAQAPHLRPNFRRRLKSLPPVGDPRKSSAVVQLQRTLGDRSLIFAGDSTTKQLFGSLEHRASDLGAKLPLVNGEAATKVKKSDRIFYNFPGMEIEKVDADEYVSRFADISRRHGAVLVLSLGTHFDHVDSYVKFVKWTFKALGRFLELSAHNRSRALFMEMPAQHFATNSGGFCFPRNGTGMTTVGMRPGLKRQEWRPDFIPDGPPMTSPHSGCWQRPNDKVGYPAGYLCRPLAAYAGEGTPPECAECDKSWNKQWATGSGWRAEVARFEAARHPRVTVLPAAALTSSLWDLHVGTMPSPDCTHFCLLPPLVEAFAHLISTGIKQQDEKPSAPPSELAALKEQLGESEAKLAAALREISTLKKDATSHAVTEGSGSKFRRRKG